MSDKHKTFRLWISAITLIVAVGMVVFVYVILPGSLDDAPTRYPYQAHYSVGEHELVFQGIEGNLGEVIYVSVEFGEVGKAIGFDSDTPWSLDFNGRVISIGELTRSDLLESGGSDVSIEDALRTHISWHGERETSAGYDRTELYVCFEKSRQERPCFLFGSGLDLMWNGQRLSLPVTASQLLAVMGPPDRFVHEDDQID